MTKNTWVVVDVNGPHSICLEHEYWSGRATITVDNRIVYHRRRKIVDWGLKQTFSVNAMDCMVRITPMPWLTFRYQLWVDGKKQQPAQ